MAFPGCLLLRWAELHCTAHANPGLAKSVMDLVGYEISEPPAGHHCTSIVRRDNQRPVSVQRQHSGRPAAGHKRFAARGSHILAPAPTDSIPMKTTKIGPKPRSFQDLIFTLQHYWSEHGCVILQPYDMEVGAGTFHTATFLRAIGPEPWSAAYVQPSRRPTDGRYGQNPFRVQHYYQFQVIIKPSPLDILDTYLGSLRALGLDPLVHDVRFVEDNWESPTLGAWGLG